MISIIVPIYNVEKYLEQCIDSLVHQTYQNIEILLVDDGSTDQSGLICDRFATVDSRVRAFHKTNGGLADTRNFGLDRAKGELIAFVDGDDWIHPQMLEFLLAAMKATDSDLGVCAFQMTQEDEAVESQRLGPPVYMIVTGTEAMLQKGHPGIIACNKLYKREVLDGVRYPVGKLHEDEYVIHRIFYQCKKICILDSECRLYYYRQRNSSIMHTINEKNIKDALDGFADRIEFAKKHAWSEVVSFTQKIYCNYCIEKYMQIKEGCSRNKSTLKKRLLYSERNMIREMKTEDKEWTIVLFSISPLLLMIYRSNEEKLRRWRSRITKLLLILKISIIG